MMRARERNKLVNCMKTQFKPTYIEGSAGMSKLIVEIKVTVSVGWDKPCDASPGSLEFNFLS